MAALGLTADQALTDPRCQLPIFNEDEKEAIDWDANAGPFLICSAYRIRTMVGIDVSNELHPYSIVPYPVYA